MSLSLKRDCPYCGTKKVAQSAVFSWLTQDRSKRGLFICGHCSEGIIRDFEIPRYNGMVDVDLMNHSGDGDFYSLLTRQEWPKAQATSAPADCPENVNTYFHQAADSLNSGNYDAAGVMFRKVLESATKAIDVQSASKPLAFRIKQLVEANLLTPALGSWADEIRLGGNEAAHEEAPLSKEDAQSLRDFSENLLRYLFTLPAAVSRRVAPSPVN